MNLTSLFIIVTLISFSLIFGFYLLPRLRRWDQRNVELISISSKKKSLLKLRNEILFHISWAKESGEEIGDFDIDLKRVENEIEDLEVKSDLVELQNISK